jgi:transposase
MEFMQTYPDDAACLDFLWRERFAPDGHHAHCPKCDQQRKFHRVKSRPSYSCDSCGRHIHPLAGTIFHKSATSLHLWFYAFYLITSTRCGISAKALERELGVTYKTAWRMFNLIGNQLMADESGPLSGDVEVDETSVDGKPRKPHGKHAYLATGPSRRSEAQNCASVVEQRCSLLWNAADGSRRRCCRRDADKRSNAR